MAGRRFLQQLLGETKRLLHLASGGGQKQGSLKQKKVIRIGRQSLAIEARGARDVLLDVGRAGRKIGAGEAVQFRLVGILDGGCRGSEQQDRQDQCCS